MTFKCSRCQSEDHYRGTLSSQVYGMVVYAGMLEFSPDKDERPFLTTETKGVGVSAMMCRECGLLELTGDVAKLRRIEDS